MAQTSVFAAAIQAARPGWRMCAADCGWPMDPSGQTDQQGRVLDRHPGCERPQLRLVRGGRSS